MAKDYKQYDLEIWLHDRSGEYFIVPEEGGECAGPYAGHRIWREYRVAVEPFEPVLATSNYLETFERKELPHPASDFIALEDDWIPDSITIYDYSKLTSVYLEALQLDWIPESALCFSWEDIDALLKQAPIAGLSKANTMFGVTEKLWIGHPPKSGIVCKSFEKGEQFAVIDIAPSRKWMASK